MKTILVMLLIDGCTSKMIEVLIDGCTSNDSNGYLNSKTDLPILDHQRSHSPIDRPEQCQEPRLSQQRIGTSWGYLTGDVSWYFFRFMIFGVYPCLILGIATIHEPGNPPKPTKKYGIFTTLVWLNYQQSSASIGIWT